MSLTLQIAWLFLLAIPIASVSWTVTHEELFRGLRDYCASKSQTCQRLIQRKFFYALTCEYCFSHYVTIAALVLTRYRLLLMDWRGYILAGFALVWIANLYMGIFGRLRLEIKHEKIDIAEEEKHLAEH